MIPRPLRRFWSHLMSAGSAWVADEGNLMSAAVAYYAALSFFPLMLILIAGLGMFLQLTELGQSAEDQVIEAIAEYASPSLAQQVRDVLARVGQKAGVSGPIGVLTLLFTALLLFAHFQYAFDRIWHVEEAEPETYMGMVFELLWYRVRAFLMVIGVGFLILLTFVSGLVLSAFQGYTEEIAWIGTGIYWFGQVALSVLLNSLLFGLIYRVLPRVTVRWSEALCGGLLAGVTWEAGRQILSVFLIGTRYASAYGIVGSMLAVMLWVYYGCAVLFLGAEYVQVLYRERRKGKPPHKDEPSQSASG